MRVGQLFTEYFLKEGIKNTPDYKLIERDENYKKNLSQLLEEIENIYNNFKIKNEKVPMRQTQKMI